MTRVLFVCLGNICRSPLAEAVFRHQVRERGVEDRFEIDSAGTSDYHIGDPPDRRSAATARKYGITVTGSGRQISADDLRTFDYIIVMDAQNLADVERLKAASGGTANVHRLREWDPESDSPDVPDPYYGGDDGFEEVQAIVERSSAALLDHLLAEAAEPA